MTKDEMHRYGELLDLMSDFYTGASRELDVAEQAEYLRLKDLFERDEENRRIERVMFPTPGKAELLSDINRRLEADSARRGKPDSLQG